jgi:signal peptidase II
MERWQRFVLVVFILGMCVGCDQVTKSLAQEKLMFSSSVSLFNDSIRFLYVENAGVTFGLGSDLPEPHRFWLFTVGAGMLLIVLFAFIMFWPSLVMHEVLAYALVLSGGISNSLDRLFNEGSVIDFIVINRGVVSSIIFNLADVAILFGLLLITWRLVLLAAAGEDPGIRVLKPSPVRAIDTRRRRDG